MITIASLWSDDYHRLQDQMRNIVMSPAMQNALRQQQQMAEQLQALASSSAMQSYFQIQQQLATQFQLSGLSSQIESLYAQIDQIVEPLRNLAIPRIEIPDIAKLFANAATAEQFTAVTSQIASRAASEGWEQVEADEIAVLPIDVRSEEIDTQIQALEAVAFDPVDPEMTFLETFVSLLSGKVTATDLLFIGGLLQIGMLTGQWGTVLLMIYGWYWHRAADSQS